MKQLHAAVLTLSRSDVKNLKIRDAYSIHRVVYDLFDDVRTEEQKRNSVPSGILYADKGGDFHRRKVVILTDRAPKKPVYGEIESKIISSTFLQHTHYAFEVTLNPGKRDNQSRKILPVRGREAITSWFIERAEAEWGFKVNPVNLQIEEMRIQRFEKASHTVTHGSATLKGELAVLEPARFVQSFSQGIGRGRAFGFGLLQIVPLKTHQTF